VFLTTITALMMLYLRPANTPRWSLPRGNRLVPSTWRADTPDSAVSVAVAEVTRLATIGTWQGEVLALV
jgi:hypothetical protein